MFALAARFSKSDVFQGVPLKDRGSRFAADAEKLYQRVERLNEMQGQPSLCYLQGCILSAFCKQVSGFGHKARILTGHCIRLAYDLELHLLDKDIITDT